MLVHSRYLIKRNIINTAVSASSSIANRQLVERQFAMQVVILAVTIPRLSRREDLVASVDSARKHLARMHGLDVFLEHEVVAECLLAQVAGGQRRRTVQVGGGVAV